MHGSGSFSFSFVLCGAAAVETHEAIGVQAAKMREKVAGKDKAIPTQPGKVAGKDKELPTQPRRVQCSAGHAEISGAGSPAL